MAAKKKKKSTAIPNDPKAKDREIRKLRKQVQTLVTGLDGFVTVWDRIALPHQPPAMVAASAGCSVGDLIMVRDLKEYWLQMAAIVVGLEFLSDSAAHFSLGLPKKRAERVATREKTLNECARETNRIFKAMRKAL